MKNALKILFLLSFALKSYASDNATQKLLTAIIDNDIQYADRAIQKGANVNAQIPLDGGPSSSTIIHKVLNSKRIEISLLIIKAEGFNLNQRKPVSQTTPLFCATSNQNVEAVRLLIEKGANINLQVTFRYPLQIAAGVNGNAEILALYLARPELNINARNRNCVLRKSIKFSNFDLFDMIVAKGSEKPFSKACLNGSLVDAYYHLNNSEDERYKTLVDKLEELKANL